MLSAEDDESFFYAETFDPIAHIWAIILTPMFSCILKLKFYQIGVKSTFLNRYLKVEVNQAVSKHVIDKDGVIKKNDFVEFSMDANNDINNMENVK